MPLEIRFIKMRSSNTGSVRTIARVGTTIRRSSFSCAWGLEEIAYHQGFIDRAGMEACIADSPKSPYREYLEMVLKEG